MTQYAYILKSPGEPDEVFTGADSLSSYSKSRWPSYHITGSSLTIQRVLSDDTVVATVQRVKLDPQVFH